MIYGTATGIAAAYIMGTASSYIGEDSCREDPTEPFCIDDEVATAMVASYSLGVAVGVSIEDPKDRFIYALAGSLAGLGTAVGLTYAYEGLWPFLLIGNAAGATILSEYSHRPSEDRRLSVGFVPNITGRMSVAAKFRFNFCGKSSPWS